MKTIKITVTGGPSGGKTTLIEALQKELGKVVSVVPESASILYRGGFPRIKSRHGLIHAQKAIYYTQKELEDLIYFEHQPQLLVCDRGSMDALAYWPEDPQNFFKLINSTPEKEYSRYDWVVHLDTAGNGNYDTTNPIRTESYSEAEMLNQRILDAWGQHPQRIRINQRKDFLSKMAAAYGVIQAILNGDDLQTIRKTFE
ncbi:ATP-binding protein [Bdellovibrio sp. HCB337]|uniref:ATP/GTP-binding protein n=1 Tax=Bdellovibrio sp. HCB337 TaxID=3394358 RepID=UPI0039A4E21E